MALSSEQKAGLWRAKLRSLAKDHFARGEGIDYDVPWGAAIAHEDGAWTALLEVLPERSFGQALVLAARNDAKSLDVLTNSDVASVARRAQLFEPSPLIWRVDGTELALAEPSELTQVPAAPLEPDVAALLAVDGVDLVIEHGVTVGEYRGLEVARVTGVGAEQRLDVGVGAYDQGAFAVMNPDMTPTESLASVVEQVRTHRQSGAGPHPINRLVRERWIRWELERDPAKIGLASVEPVEPASPREGIKDAGIAPAVGHAEDGTSVLVACTVGIDLDAIPAAADLAELHQTDRIMMVLADRDRHPLVQAVARQSKRPVEFVTAPEPWV